MHEVELKLQVPPAARRAVDAAVAGRTPARRQHLRAAYADTPDAALAAARLALRVRREGRRWVQTLKGAGEHTLQRFEHDVPLVHAGAEVPAIDPALHRGTPVGERLLALLGETDVGALALRYETDVQRRTRVQRVGRAQIELAFDTGTIRSGELEWPLCELELELLAGPPDVLIEQAQRWIERHGLWIDTRSKAERGELLARGTRIAPSRTAQATPLARSMSAGAAWRSVLRECAAQIGANASQIAAGEFGDEHVHQLRVGLRRLRSALQLFEIDDAALAPPAAALFRELGVARDRVVVEAGFAAPLREALASIGVTLPPPSAHELRDTRGEADALCALVRGAPTQALLLALLRAAATGDADIDAAERGARTDRAAGAGRGDRTERTERANRAAAEIDEPEPGAEPLARRLARRIARWHASAARDAKRYAELDDPARHRLRKRIKRLRYAIEFCGDLFDRKGVKRYLKPLRVLQERLGEINDIGVAIAALRAHETGGHAADAQRWFALGWLSARRDELVAQARPDLKAFAKADAFWRER